MRSNVFNFSLFAFSNQKIKYDAFTNTASLRVSGPDAALLSPRCSSPPLPSSLSHIHSYHWAAVVPYLLSGRPLPQRHATRPAGEQAQLRLPRFLHTVSLSRRLFGINGGLGNDALYSKREPSCPEDFRIRKRDAVVRRAS